VPDAELTAAWIGEHVVPLLTDPAALSGLAGAAARAGVPDADERLASIVLEVAR
jgi:UDP-N-acetylglucosamine--N-acetylmuramyl-(pentapeptide) pyrophosphoryl-undecaprenol N-acetylglucosamine transferase